MSGKRLNSIQIIRALAFIAIFLSHVELTSTGAAGVSIFFVLSGFCLIYTYYPNQNLEIGGGYIRRYIICD